MCDEVTPPDRDIGPGHWIHCHHPVAFLSGLDPTVPQPDVVPEPGISSLASSG
jgi:hypothetical protein